MNFLQWKKTTYGTYRYPELLTAVDNDFLVVSTDYAGCVRKTHVSGNVLAG